MLLGTKKTLFDHITEALLSKPASVADLAMVLKAKNVNVTVQGIYKTLRELVAEDIVVKQKKLYLISNVWREKIEELVSRRERFKLSPGETVSYRFNKLEHLDAFWKHTLADIEIENGRFPVFHFTPHQFWSYVPGRFESEREFYRDLAKRDASAYTVIGGNSAMDRAARELLRNDAHQVHLDPAISFSRRDHISVLGSYVVTTRLSIPLARHMDEAYEKIQDEEVLTTTLLPLFEKFGSVQMTVEHDVEKAQKLRKRMAADFHIPRELRERFDLF